LIKINSYYESYLLIFSNMDKVRNSISELRSKLEDVRFNSLDKLAVLWEINNFLVWGYLVWEEKEYFEKRYNSLILEIDEKGLFQDEYDYLIFKSYYYYLTHKTKRLFTLINSSDLSRNNELVLLLIDLMVKDKFSTEDVFYFVELVLNNTNNISNIKKLKEILIWDYKYDLSEFELLEIELVKRENKIFIENKLYILCLANSKKYNERCIAWIVVYLDEKLHKLEITNHWIRPTSNSEHWEILNSMVNDINMFDIIELEKPIYNPSSYQTENYRVENIKKIKNIPITYEICNHFLYQNPDGLFWDESNKISAFDINKIDYSLIYIKISKLIITQRQTHSNKIQLRWVFKYLSTQYDLPITDIDFINKFSADEHLLNDILNTYLTISLWVEYGWSHYKLIAGVLFF